jgi:hypothetical protein
MTLLRNLLDRLLLIAAVVAAGLVPGFIAQYRQRLGGMLDQARIDLAPWQAIADQNHHGDLDELVRYHLASSDPTFHAEGSAIAQLVDNVQRLQAEVTALQASLWQQLGHLASHLDRAVARATWTDWVPTFALSFEGLLFAFAFAFVLWLAFQLLWSGAAWALLRWRDARGGVRRPANRLP